MWTINILDRIIWRCSEKSILQVGKNSPEQRSWSKLYNLYSDHYLLYLRQFPCSLEAQVRYFFVNDSWFSFFRPDLLILNGPGTCIPIALATALLNLFCLGDACIIYEESICRVQQLSLSGQLLYYMRLTDELIVQWPQLVQKYPMCKLIEEL